jgi:hypothetical protein
MKNGHNVVWCASFLAAWKSLQKGLEGEPVQLEDADEHCMPLNEADDPENSLPPGALYAGAGWVQKGIVETIRETVKKMFPTKEPPLFPGISDNSFLAYAYLEANVPFKLPYFQNREPLTAVKWKSILLGLEQKMILHITVSGINQPFFSPKEMPSTNSRSLWSIYAEIRNQARSLLLA